MESFRPMKRMRSFNTTGNQCDIDAGDYVKHPDDECDTNYYEINSHCCRISNKQKTGAVKLKWQRTISKAFEEYVNREILEKKKQIDSLNFKKTNLHTKTRKVNREMLKLKEDCENKTNELLDSITNLESEEKNIIDEIKNLENEIIEEKKKIENNKKKKQVIGKMQTPRRSIRFTEPTDQPQPQPLIPKHSFLPLPDIDSLEDNQMLGDMNDIQWSNAFASPLANKQPKKRSLKISPPRTPLPKTPPHRTLQHRSQPMLLRSPSLMPQQSPLNLELNTISPDFIPGTPLSQLESPDRVYSTPRSERRRGRQRQITYNPIPIPNLNNIISSSINNSPSLDILLRDDTTNITPQSPSKKKPKSKRSRNSPSNNPKTKRTKTSPKN